MPNESTQCDNSNDKIVNYWLLFFDKPFLLSPFLKKGFGHVAILTNIDGEWWTIDSNFKRLQIEKVKEGDIVFQHKKLIINKKQATKKQWRLGFYFLSCVTIAQYVMGIKLFAFTPYGFYKKLLHLSDKKRKLNGIISITGE